MPAPTYINIEYFFYKAFIFLKKAYLFAINMPWHSIIFWAKIISAIIVILFVAGVIYNLVGIVRARKKKKEEEL